MTYSRSLLIAALLLLATGAAAQDDRVVARNALATGFRLLDGNTEAALTEALAKFAEARNLYQTLNDRNKEAEAMVGLGRAYLALNQTQQAVETFEAALTVAGKAAEADSGLQGAILNQLAEIRLDRRERPEALALFEKALRLAVSAGEQVSEAIVRSNIGGAHREMGNLTSALDSFESSLRVWNLVKDRASQARTLNEIGEVLNGLERSPEALEKHLEALRYSRDPDVRDRRLEADTLNHLGITYESIGQRQKALASYQHALDLSKLPDVDDPDLQATLFNNIGGIYDALGEKAIALQHYEKSLELSRERPQRNQKVITTALTNIGRVHDETGRGEAALEYFQRALKISRSPEGRDLYLEATTLNSIGHVYDTSGNEAKALEAYQQSLALSRSPELMSQSLEATALTNIGGVYHDLGDKQKALEYYARAVPLRHASDDEAGEAVTLNNLMYLLGEDRAQRRLAIFFGKEAVGIRQKLRRTVRALETAAQRSYLRTMQHSYRMLAELLIDDGRLAEAHQVLNLYKDQELLDVLDGSGDAVEAPSLYLTEGEKDAADRYRRVSDDRSPPLLTAIEAAFASRPSVTPAADVDIDASRELQAALRGLSRQTGSKTVALYSVMGEKNVRILLITPDSMKASPPYPVESRSLNEKVLQFLGLLQSPQADPRPQAKELYDILFKPIEADLRATGAQTLLWSLDGVLRYIPAAALYDGSRYLVERYRSVIFTRANSRAMAAPVTGKWTGLGLGSSKGGSVAVNGRLVGFESLESVDRELHAIFGGNQRQGVVAGAVLRNDAFTRPAMLAALRERRPLIHIASHFRFQAGDESASFLLLGDGTSMTLAEMKAVPDLFKGVELLTLAACSTATQRPGANGREIDGLGELAQRKGAKAVVASLWQVDDESTSELMTEFYRVVQNPSRPTKAAALQRAQLLLLHGKRSARQPRRGDQARGVSVTTATPFVAPAGVPYAHPYYWAPFILIGNSR